MDEKAEIWQNIINWASIFLFNPNAEHFESIWDSLHMNLKNISNIYAALTA